MAASFLTPPQSTIEAKNHEQSIKDKYHVVGLPTVIMLGADGQERARITEFMPPEQFLTTLRAVN